MSAAILPAPPAADSPRRKRFTRSEVDRMQQLGIFAWLIGLFGPDRLLIKSPVEVKAGDSEWSLPEPDVAVLAEASVDYGKRFPRGDELLLAVEVADTSLRQDLTTKRDLYARASVGEYWVLDLQSCRLIVHRHPGQGEYGETAILNEDETASCAAHPEQTIAVRYLLP